MACLLTRERMQRLEVISERGFLCAALGWKAALPGEGYCDAEAGYCARPAQKVSYLITPQA